MPISINTTLGKILSDNPQKQEETSLTQQRVFKGDLNENNSKRHFRCLSTRCIIWRYVCIRYTS